MSSAIEFANKILTGLGFDLDLIGDVPMHIASEIEQRDAATRSGCKCVCHEYPDHTKLQDALEALKLHQEQLAAARRAREGAGQ